MRKLALLIFAAIFLFSCKKNNNDTTISLEVTANNIAGTYKITDATASQAGFTVNVFNNAAVFNPCLKDDVYTFAANGTYTVADGANVCSPSTTVTNGTYTVNTAAKTITINGQTGTIVTLTATTVVVTQPNFQGSGVAITATYTRQ